MVDTPWPGRLAELCGVSVDEFEAFPDHVWAKVAYKGKEYDARWWADVLTAQTAQVQATYDDRFYQGAPAITKNAVGKGSAIYFAAAGCADLYEDYLRDLLTELGIFTTALPYNVYLSTRASAEKRYAFVCNFNLDPRTVAISAKGVNILTGESVDGCVTVGGTDVALIECE